jgi:hypothetical protein
LNTGFEGAVLFAGVVVGMALSLEGVGVAARIVPKLLSSTNTLEVDVVGVVCCVGVVASGGLGGFIRKQ